MNRDEAEKRSQNNAVDARPNRTMAIQVMIVYLSGATVLYGNVLFNKYIKGSNEEWKRKIATLSQETIGGNKAQFLVSIVAVMVMMTIGLWWYKRLRSKASVADGDNRTQL